jgi:hypothetical protein
MPHRARGTAHICHAFNNNLTIGYLQTQMEEWESTGCSIGGHRGGGRSSLDVDDTEWKVVMGKKTQVGPTSTSGQPSLHLGGIFLRAAADLRSDPKARPIAEKAWEYLRREIKENDRATRYFESLCSEGCDAQELLWLMAACSENPEPDRVDKFMGFNARQLKAIVQGFCGSADRIEQINSALVGKIFKVADVRSPSRLPAELRDFATLVEFVAGLRWRAYWAVAKKRLIQYVHQRTGHYYDRRVAELIATASDCDDYAENAHREWRRRNLRRNDYLKLPRTSSAGFVRRAGPLVKKVFVMCLYVLLVRLSHRK